MARDTWTVVHHDGSETDIVTIGGLGPVQAVENAGLMMSDIQCIRPSSIALVEDIGAWRRFEA